MNLKTKLKTAFFIMAALPVILGTLAVFFITRRELSQVRNVYGADFRLSDMYSSGALLGKITDTTFAEVQKQAVENADVFFDRDYLAGLNSEVEGKLSQLVVRRGDEIYYNSSSYTEAELEEILPGAVTARGLGGSAVYEGGRFQTIVKCVTFRASDGEGSVCLITPLRQTLPQFKNLVIQVVLIVIEVIAFTSFILYLWLNRSIIKPIDRLRLGTQNIRDGNLDFEIRTRKKDELGDLCRDFEEMRNRLNKSENDKKKSDVEEKELIRNISHDLKTPLTAIKGYVEGLRDGIAATPEKQKKYILTIANKVEDMDRLIDELTLFSRLDTNRIPYDFIKINAKDYFDDCVDEIKLDLESMDIILKYNFHGGDDMYTMADPNQLKRVINNIVSNSVKYRRAGVKCTIGIEVFDEGDYIHLVMSDNGKGINMKDLPRIFDRFYRTDESRTSPQTGSGIGLAIVKKIIDDHKGRIWVDSTEGEGTTFHINLLRYKEGMQLTLPDNQMKSKSRKKK